MNACYKLTRDWWEALCWPVCAPRNYHRWTSLMLAMVTPNVCAKTCLSSVAWRVSVTGKVARDAWDWSSCVSILSEEQPMVRLLSRPEDQWENLRNICRNFTYGYLCALTLLLAIPWVPKICWLLGVVHSCARGLQNISKVNKLKDSIYSCWSSPACFDFPKSMDC